MFILKVLILHFIEDKHFRLEKYQLELKNEKSLVVSRRGVQVKGNMDISVHSKDDETHLVVECKVKNLNDGLHQCIGYLMKKENDEEGVNYLFVEFSNFIRYSFLLTRLTSFFSESHMACSSSELTGP